MNTGDLTSTQLAHEIDTINVNILDGFGISRMQLNETIDSWPALTPIQSVLILANAQLVRMREKNKAELHQKMLNAAKQAIAILQTRSEEVTPLAIATLLVNEENGPTIKIKEKARKLMRILGEGYHQMLQ